VTVAGTPDAGGVNGALATSGFGGSFGTKYAWYTASTAKQRKMARKTRFSMY
jgi:hypothetical protein